MLNWSLMNHRLQQLSLKAIRRICHNHDVTIADGDLKIILRIIKNNPYPVLNDDYAPILLFEISNETSQMTCEKFKPLIEQRYLIQEIE